MTTGGADETSRSPFSHADLGERIPALHPLRRIRRVVYGALAGLGAGFEALCSDFSRPSPAPERLIRASLIRIPLSARFERQLREQMRYGLPFRWIVGLGIDDPASGEGRPEIRPVGRSRP